MDTKSKAERFLNMMTGDESMLAQDGIEVAQAYLDKCHEVERLNNLIMYGSNFVESTVRNNALEEAAKHVEKYGSHSVADELRALKSNDS